MITAESYTLGYGKDAVSFVGRRRAATHAAFLLPRLRPGLRLLDCGCGPGTITMDLARLVAPGDVVGVDREQSQMDLAAENARKLGLANARFQAGSVYELEFPERAFDAVFAHALFEHIKSPLLALREFRRILAPGGIAAIRSPDWGGFLVSPEFPAVNDALEYFKFLQTKNGGDVYVGRKLKGLMAAAGFKDVVATAAYECCEPVSYVTEFLAARIEASLEQDNAVARGWATEEKIGEMSAGLRTLAQNPSAFFALAWCEVIGTA